MSRRALLALTWTVLILVLCLFPRRWVPEEDRGTAHFRIPHLDKAIHATLFAGFGFLWARADAAGRRTWVILAGGVLLAVGTELAQGSPYVARDPDVFDGLADVVGLVAGVGVARLQIGRRVH